MVDNDLNKFSFVVAFLASVISLSSFKQEIKNINYHVPYFNSVYKAGIFFVVLLGMTVYFYALTLAFRKFNRSLLFFANALYILSSVYPLFVCLLIAVDRLPAPIPVSIFEIIIAIGTLVLIIKKSINSSRKVMVSIGIKYYSEALLHRNYVYEHLLNNDYQRAYTECLITIYWSLKSLAGLNKDWAFSLENETLFDVIDQKEYLDENIKLELEKVPVEVFGKKKVNVSYKKKDVKDLANTADRILDAAYDIASIIDPSLESTRSSNIKEFLD